MKDNTDSSYDEKVIGITIVAGLMVAIIVLVSFISFRNNTEESYNSRNIVSESKIFISKKPITPATIKLLERGIDENNIFSKNKEELSNITFKDLDSVKILNKDGNKLICIINYYKKSNEKVPSGIDTSKRTIEVLSVE